MLRGGRDADLGPALEASSVWRPFRGVLDVRRYESRRCQREASVLRCALEIRSFYLCDVDVQGPIRALHVRHRASGVVRAADWKSKDVY